MTVDFANSELATSGLAPKTVAERRGIVMMFARGLSEFGAVVIVAYHPMVTPVMIYERFTSYGLKYAQPLSVLFILVCLLFFLRVSSCPFFPGC